MSPSTRGLGLIAAGCLILAQCFIAISFKASQTVGHSYTFSQASSLTLTELIKLLLSIALFARGNVNGSGNSSMERGLGTPAETHYVDDEEAQQQEEKQQGQQDGLLKRYTSSASPRVDDRVTRKRNHRFKPSWYERWKAELSREGVIGFGALSVLYAINNHAAFFVYRLADPGTIQLVKASSTIISAGTMLLFLSRPMPELQWHALIVQSLGLAVTQLGNVNIHYSPSVYAILLGMTSISSLAGVMNDHLLKTTRASLHAQNMVLYAFGVFINFTIFCYMKFNDPRGVPSFFTGYGSTGAVSLVFLNASLGLIITAVYKYADAIVKGIATTLTTAILIILSAAFFNAPLTWVAGIGCVVVFLTSYTFVKVAATSTFNRDGPPPPIRLVQGSIVFFGIFTGIVVICNTFGWPGSTPAHSAIPTSFPPMSSRPAPTPIAFSTLAPIPTPTPTPTPTKMIIPIVEKVKSLPVGKYKPPVSSYVQDPTCVRTPLPQTPGRFEGTRTFHRFDNVLMIVFFNAAHYNGNLESFNDAYSEYFPNMVFIGSEPAEDDLEGLYDGVIIDSYRAAGQRGSHGHHMLWKAMDRYPCYEGYLWTASDVWLNIPHLSLFPLDLVWYSFQDSMIVPSPGLTQEHYGWMIYSSDHKPYWQFADPETGKDVCLAGLKKVPSQLIANITDADTGVQRLHGGPADAAYIPGRHREAFLQIIEPLSECFLEIALPTALQALRGSGEGEKVALLNAINDLHNRDWAFWVWNEWDMGREIDAYHQWHWRSEIDGKWKVALGAIAGARGLWKAGFSRIAEGNRI